MDNVEPLSLKRKLLVYPCSFVRRRCCCRRRCPQCSNNVQASPLKPLGLSIAKRRVEHLYEGGTEVCINDSGHMTNMYAMYL